MRAHVSGWMRIENIAQYNSRYRRDPFACDGNVVYKARGECITTVNVEITVVLIKI